MSAAPPRTAVLFDLDGLLVDSEPLWSLAEADLATDLGGVWSPRMKAAVAGTRLDTAVPIILSGYGVEPTPAAVQQASDYLLDRMVTLYAGPLTVFDGAVELLDALRALGAPTALVSSSYRRLVDAALRVLGPDRFDVTIAGDEVTAGKPDPEPYLTACDALGVSPARAVVLEDAPSGVAAGEAAGCTVVAVPSVAPIEPTPTRAVVATLAEIDAGWLVGLPDTIAASSAS